MYNGYMFILLDESGSLNSLKEGFFSITMIIINKKEDFQKFKNYFKRNIKRIKKENGIPKETELKGRFLNRKKLNKEGEKIFNSIKEKFSIFTFYFDNKDIEEKFLERKEITFNYMVKYGIENLILEKIIKQNEETIKLYLDQRSIKKGSLNSLKEYLFLHFKLQKNYNINFEEVRYFESKNNWFIQLADICSFYNSKAIKNSKLRKQRNVKKIEY